MIFLLTPCLLGTAGGETEPVSGDLGGRGGSSADIRALKEGCWLLWSPLLLATGGRPELPVELIPDDEGEFFLLKGMGAPDDVDGVCCRGFGKGAGAVVGDSCSEQEVRRCVYGHIN